MICQSCVEKNREKKGTSTAMILIPKKMVVLSRLLAWILDKGCSRHMVNRQ